VPDLPGFGRTTAPKELEAYSYKSVIDDLVAIVKHVQGEQHEGEKIVLGGHDWGGAGVWYVFFFASLPLFVVLSVSRGSRETDGIIFFLPPARKQASSGFIDELY
jgi:hypothetical protein